MTHNYAAHLLWTGNLGPGTTSYAGYGRGHVVRIDGKPDLLCTADPIFRGEADRHNPEDLLVAALTGCHMLSYLALCARRGVRVVAYEDRATGTLATRPDGGGRFESVTLAPVVTVAHGSDEALAMQLHDDAHALCFIASSCNFPVRHRAAIRTAAPDQP